MTDTMDNRPATARRRLITAATSAAAGMALPGWLALGTGSARAQQAYPSRPIKLVVGYPPGGSGDFVSRVIADGISRELGVSVVVENRPGAGGSIASDYVAKSAPDGYTLVNAGPPAVLKALYKKLAYNPETDLAPVSLVAVGPMIICVNNALPVRTLGELIAYARANPEKLFSLSLIHISEPTRPY